MPYLVKKVGGLALVLLGGLTIVHGVVAQRFCFVNWRTTAADVEEIVRLLETTADRLARAKGNNG